VSKYEHLVAQGINACPVCWREHDGPEGHFCAICIGARQTVATAGHPEAWASANRRVYRPDGYGCVERVHPTELAIERLDRSGPEDGGW